MELSWPWWKGGWRIGRCIPAHGEVEKLGVDVLLIGELHLNKLIGMEVGLDVEKSWVSVLQCGSCGRE